MRQLKETLLDRNYEVPGDTIVWGWLKDPVFYRLAREIWRINNSEFVQECLPELADISDKIGALLKKFNDAEECGRCQGTHRDDDYTMLKQTLKEMQSEADGFKVKHPSRIESYKDIPIYQAAIEFLTVPRVLKIVTKWKEPYSSIFLDVGVGYKRLVVANQDGISDSDFEVMWREAEKVCKKYKGIKCSYNPSYEETHVYKAIYLEDTRS